MDSRTLAAVLLTAAMPAAGCGQPQVVAYGDAGTGNVDRPAFGRLVVHTDSYLHLDGDIARFPHLPYDVYARDGVLLKRVANHLGECDESPSVVRLPPGEYRIVARTKGRRRAEFTVRVEANRTTEVDVAKLANSRSP